MFYFKIEGQGGLNLCMMQHTAPCLGIIGPLSSCHCKTLSTASIKSAGRNAAQVKADTPGTPGQGLLLSRYLWCRRLSCEASSLRQWHWQQRGRQAATGQCLAPEQSPTCGCALACCRRSISWCPLLVQQQVRSQAFHCCDIMYPSSPGLATERAQRPISWVLTGDSSRMQVLSLCK